MLHKSCPLTGPSRRLYFVRHGQSTWNLEGRIQGQIKSPPLTELGRAQARETAAKLAGTSANTLLTSDATRAVQTAAIIGAALGLTPTRTSLLREQHWGTLQGQTSDWAWAVAKGLQDDQRVPGSESRLDVRARLSQLLRCDVIRNAPGAVVLISHGDTIAEAIRLLTGKEPAETASGNGSIACVTLRESSPKCICETMVQDTLVVLLHATFRGDLHRSRRQPEASRARMRSLSRTRLWRSRAVSSTSESGSTRSALGITLVVADPRATQDCTPSGSTE